jgi:phytoene synthase|tara:strand:+ start:2808 stop:3719 length:912 start_codon:yes stop_codon:yes gene_type:complete
MHNSQAKQVLAHNGKSFYWASLFLGSELADRAARLYQFCRFVDDLADGDLPHRLDSLEDIRAGLTDSQHPAVATIPELEAFIALATEANIPLKAAGELLDGMLRDQHPTALETEAELLRYCHAVAGTVGLMMCRVLNCEHRRADAFAIDLGVAMQLTNIARDVLEDAKMDRRYLPANWLDAPLSPETIANAANDCHLPVAAAINQLLELADEYYASALIGIHLLPWRSRFSIIVALRVYGQIGRQLKQGGLQWWRGRTVVNKITKARLSITSLIDLLSGLGWKKIPQHNAKLHRELKGLAGVE